MREKPSNATIISSAFLVRYEFKIFCTRLQAFRPTAFHPPFPPILYFTYIRVQDKNFDRLSRQSEQRGWVDKRQNFIISVSRRTMLRLGGGTHTNSE
jgi:hypothetical protein